MFHAQVVMDVVSEAVSAGELDQVRAQLPGEYDDQFEVAEAEESPGPE